MTSPNFGRHDYLSWGDYFMYSALLASKRSKDPKCQVGACIVGKNNEIIGIGYNGFPRGCSDNDFPWEKSQDIVESKHTYVCHAELNAIVNTNVKDTQDCTMYVTRFPCNECAKLIIQKGITKIFYLYRKNDDVTEASMKMLKAACVKYEKYYLEQDCLVLQYEERQ